MGSQGRIQDFFKGGDFCNGVGGGGDYSFSEVVVVVVVNFI